MERIMASSLQRHEPPGETSATSERPVQQLAAGTLRFDLASELEALLAEDIWRRSDRNAKTLVKDQHLHITLIALKAGARLDEHQTEGPLTIHTIKGQLRVSVQGDAFDLGMGALLKMEAGAPHAVEAVAESAFLITVGWPR